jgi:hypothetical protein
VSSTGGISRAQAQVDPGRWLNAALFGLAVLGALAGASILFLHLTRDPLADVHAYYDAATRLNRGLPLYEQTATTETSHYYFYPPLLAILFRPLARLPFEVAAAIWEVFLLAVFAATIWLLGLRNRWTWLALGWLAPAVAWSLVVAQAHVLVTFLMTLGTPLGLAFAGHLKVFPALAAIYWIGRRDWARFRRFVAWLVGITVFCLVLEPNGTIAFLSFPSFELVGEVTNLSPYAVSPLLWAGMVVALAVASLVLARTRYGWLSAVAITVFANPRLLLYQFSSFLAAVRPPAGERDV